MNFLQGRVKAAEGSYYHKEQEHAVATRRAQLEEMGLLNQPSPINDTKRLLAACDALPEILAHSLPINAVRPQKVRSTPGYYVHQAKPSSGGMFNELTRRTYVDQITLGSTMNTGRSKWAAGTLESESTSIWDVSAAQRLMMDGAKKHCDPNRLQYVVPPKPVPVVKVVGVPIRVMPDPTPGRALFWGSMMCLFAFSTGLKLTCRSLEISSLEDVKPKLAPQVASIAARVHAMVEPFKAVKEDFRDVNGVEFMFAKQLKTQMR